MRFSFDPVAFLLSCIGMIMIIYGIKEHSYQVGIIGGILMTTRIK